MRHPGARRDSEVELAYVGLGEDERRSEHYLQAADALDDGVGAEVAGPEGLSDLGVMTCDAIAATA